MAKRIQMRKQRFVAIQKIASEQKKMPPVDCPPVGDPHTLSKMGTLGRCPPGRPSVSCSVISFATIILRVYIYISIYRLLQVLRTKFSGGPVQGSRPKGALERRDPWKHYKRGQKRSRRGKSRPSTPYSSPWEGKFYKCFLIISSANKLAILILYTMLLCVLLSVFKCIYWFYMIAGDACPNYYDDSIRIHEYVVWFQDISKLLGMTPSDIDKYSRIVFPVCFVCFNLMYWIIYLHVSDVVADDLVLLEEDK